MYDVITSAPKSILMKNYELYIEGKQLELDDQFDFSLIFKSSVFTELTGVQANRTTSIKLPKTIENLKAIDFSNIPENQTLFPYRTKPVELYRNGILIVQNGKGYILAISDYIEFCIIWGVDINIKQLQNIKLRDLDGSDYVDWLSNGFGAFVTQTNNYGFAIADFINTTNPDLRNKIFHPFVFVDWIFNKIKDKAGYQFLFPSYILDLYNKLYIPLTDRNPAKLINGEDVLKFNFNGNFQINVIQGEDTYNFVSGNQIEIKDDCIVTFSGHVVYPTTPVNGIWSSKWSKIHIYKNNIQQNEVYSESYNIEITENIEIECTDGDIITFMLETRWDNGQLWPFDKRKSTWNDTVNTNIGSISGYYTMNIKPVEIKPGKKFPIIPNLPDISAMDMIHTITSMFGLFANITESGIDFFSIDEIYANINKAVDWTNKLITGKKIDEIDFSLENFARQNWLKYTDDDTVNINADYYLQVNSDILEAASDLYQMKFAASDSSSINPNIPVIYIPVYSLKEGTFIIDENFDYLEYKSVKPRICTIEFGEETNTPRAYFTSELSFLELISQFYSNYQKIILNPKIIQSQFILTDLDIYKIDMMTPVYLEQTGN